MNRIISDTFEQLEQLGKATAKQAVQQPKKMVEEAASAVGGKKIKEEIEKIQSGSHLRGVDGVDSKSGRPKLTQVQIAQRIEKAAQMRSRLHLQEIEEQIRKIQEQRLEQIRRLQEEASKKEEQEEQPQEAQLPAKKKRGILPISVKRLKQKVEGWRGTSR